MSKRLSQTPEYIAWINMRRRCGYIKGNAVYAEKGIKVFYAWHDFKIFYAYMGPKPSQNHVLDRINNNGHYEPGNVRWATTEESSINKSNNKLYELDGQFYTVNQLAKLSGMSYDRIYQRLKAGWAVKEAINLGARFV